MPISQYRMLTLAKASLTILDLLELVKDQLDRIESALSTEPMEAIAVVQYIRATIVANQPDSTTIGAIYVENERFSGQRLRENERAREKQRLARERRKGQGQAPQESDLLPNPWAKAQAPQESSPKVTRRSLSLSATPSQAKLTNPTEPIPNLSDYIDGYRPGHSPQAIPQATDLEDL